MQQNNTTAAGFVEYILEEIMIYILDCITSFIVDHLPTAEWLKLFKEIELLSNPLDRAYVAS